MSEGFLLDTNALSALGPQKDGVISADRFLARTWIEANSEECYLPATAIAEIAQGVGFLEASGATRRANALAT